MSITARSRSRYQVEIQAGNHQFISDEPTSIGGDDAGPSPFDLLLASLASCTIITLQMYAGRKQWPLDGVEVQLNIRSDEQVAPDGKKHRSSVIEMDLSYSGPLSMEQIERLNDIATRCPIHRTLTGDVKILAKSAGATAVYP